MRGGIQELDSFARQALAQGLDRESIKKALIIAGWGPEQASAALDAYADIPFPIPIPRPRAQLSAREAFLYLLLFTTLYLTCYHVGSLAFDLINHALPDAAVRVFAFNGEDSVRWSVAYLLIGFPAFAFLAHHVGTDVARQPIKRLSPVRRWLTYLTLYIAAGTLLGDLVTLVYNVLAGELTGRIVLKVTVVLAIAGTVFGYYLSDLHREGHAVGRGTAIVVAAATVTVALMVSAMLILASPEIERQRRLDAARVEDLQLIERLVDGFAKTHGALPPDIDTLAHEPGYSVPPHGPDSGSAYEYERTSANSFRLCANFATDSADAEVAGSYSRALNTAWAHGRGRQCFERHADVTRR